MCSTVYMQDQANIHEVCKSSISKLVLELRTLKWNLYVNPTYLKVHFTLVIGLCDGISASEFLGGQSVRKKHSVITSVRGPEHTPSLLKTLNALRILKSLCISENRETISFSSYEHFTNCQRILFFFFKHLTFQDILWETLYIGRNLLIRTQLIQNPRNINLIIYSQINVCQNEGHELIGL